MSPKGKLENMLDVLRSYVRQETIDPLKSLFGSVIFLFAGSVFISFGFIGISIGLVLFLQRFDVFQSWFTWVPYLSASLFLCAAVFFSVRVLIVKKGRNA